MGKTLKEWKLKLGKKRLKLEKKRLGLGERKTTGRRDRGNIALKSVGVATSAVVIASILLYGLNASVDTMAIAGAALWVGVAGLAYKFFSDKKT